MTDSTPEGTETQPAQGGPKPVTPLHMTVLVLFTTGVLAIPAVILLGMWLKFDALTPVIFIGSACLLLSALWSFGRDTSMWLSATARIARTRGILPTTGLTPFESGETRDDTDLALAEDESRLDRRRITKAVADARRRSPRLKQPPPAE